MSWTIDPMHTQVEFSARHMGIMTVKGHFTGVHAAIDFNEDDFTASSVEATIDTRTLTTNDERRDTHLKSPDFLNVDQFPTIAFRSTRIEHAAHDQYKITGHLTIRDVTRPVTLDVVYSGQGKDPMGNVHAGFSAYTTINRKDWGLTWNVALETGGLLVGEEVKLALEVEAVKAAEIATAAEAQHREKGVIAMSKGGAKRIRVGIIGANPDRGWAAQAHIPALRSLADDFEMTALSTTRRESADAGKLFGVPLAFDNHQELVNSPTVDVVVVTVKVPYHLELATAALDAGKALYCEWPLGNGLQEAETLAALAKKKGALAVAGLQARSAPSVAYVRDLITQGYVGEVLSTTLIGSGMGWGPTVEPSNAYLNDKKNGATMLSIALGHAADALCYCLGEIRELSATMTVRRTTVTIAETGESTPMTAEDQVCVSGLLEGGAVVSIHYRGGRSRGTNLLWEINGTEGDLQLTAGGQAQIFAMDVHGGKGAQSSLDVLPVPGQYWWSPRQVPGPTTNVAQAYARFARDYREGTHLCPTFDDAVTRHRMLNAIETAAATGQRQTLG